MKMRRTKIQERDYIPVLHRYGCTLDRLFK